MPERWIRIPSPGSLKLSWGTRAIARPAFWKNAVTPSALRKSATSITSRAGCFINTSMTPTISMRSAEKRMTVPAGWCMIRRKEGLDDSFHDHDRFYAGWLSDQEIGGIGARHHRPFALDL